MLDANNSHALLKAAHCIVYCELACGKRKQCRRKTARGRPSWFWWTDVITGLRPLAVMLPFVLLCSSQRAELSASLLIMAAIKIDPPLPLPLASSRLRHPFQSEDSSWVSFSLNQNSNGGTTVVFAAIPFLTKRNNDDKITLFESANHVYSVLFTSHSKVWILSKSDKSSVSSPCQLLIGRVFLKSEWLDWYFSWKAFQTLSNVLDYNNTNNVSTAKHWKSGYTSNGHCCDSKASSSRFCVLIQVLLCKIARTFFLFFFTPI